MIDLWRRPDAELRAVTKGGPMTRAKLTGLRRNLAVAIGNSGDSRPIDALTDAATNRRLSTTRLCVHMWMGAQPKAQSLKPEPGPSRSQKPRAKSRTRAQHQTV